MANTKVSQLPNLNTVDSTTTFLVSSNATGTLTSYKATIGNVTTAVLANVGNITAVNLDGNGSNVLYGNGVFAPPSGVLPLANGNTNFDIATMGGNATITTNGTYTWTFGTDGNLIFSGNGLIANPANSSQDPLNPNVSTLSFRPDVNYGQELVIDPTAPGHIHIRTNTNGNIDEPAANLFLGGEASSFEVGIWTGLAPNLFIHSNNYTWTFDNDGNITLPSNTVAINFANGSPAFGNIAGINLDGSSSNVLYGNGVFGSISAQLTTYAQTLVVDPNGNDITGNGSVNAPFASVQKAHDYAANNISSAAYVAIKLNAGNYAGNVTLSRPRTAIVGTSDGAMRSSWITGLVTINMTSGATVLSSDIFALENVIVTNNSNVIRLAGNQRYVFFARNTYAVTSSSANVFEVTNTSSGGIKVDLFNTFLQSEGSGAVLVTNNTYYLNINQSIIAANSGPAIRTTTTSGIIGTTRISTVTGSNVVINVSQFAANTAMSYGVCTFESTATNGNGLYLSSGSLTVLGGCAFSIPTGTGFAVAGASGSVLIKSANNNQITYSTNGTTQGTVTVLPMNYL